MAQAENVEWAHSNLLIDAGARLSRADRQSADACLLAEKKELDTLNATTF